MRKPSPQTLKLDRFILATIREQLGRNFVSLICIGSRANADDVSDSDYDGYCLVRDKKGARVNLSAVEKEFGIRVGIGLLVWSNMIDCVERLKRGEDNDRSWRLASIKLGYSRHVGGRNLVKLIPPWSKFPPLDWRKQAQREYWLSVDPDSPANVYRREPRRHVGFIIGFCTGILVAKGVVVRKARLPEAIKKHHPQFGVVRLLRRAIKRRDDWVAIGNDPAVIKAARKDLDQFLKEAKRYSFTGKPTDLTTEDAANWRKSVLK